MSQLLDDKLVIDDGRENKLKDVDADLRDQISKKLFKKLNEQQIGLKMIKSWEHGVAQRSLWSERQKAWMSSWDEHLIGDSRGSFSGSSNLHIPMPYIVCKTLHARFLQAIWQDQPFNAKAQNEASIDRVPLVADVIRYYLQSGANNNKGVGKIIDAWLWGWITEGSGLLKARWDVQYSRFVDVQSVAKQGAPQVQIDPQSGQQILVPTQVMVDEEVERVKKCFDGPVFELVDLEDLLIVGGAGEPNDADNLIHRDYLTASQLWTLVDRKIFDREAVEKIIAGGPDLKEGAIGNDIKSARAQNAGRTEVDSDQDLDRYEILECYPRVDVDGSGINSEVILWVHKRSGELCRATYLYRVSPSGKKPFFKIDFQPRKNQEYAVGMVEILYPLSKEMDMIHNMRIDFGIISVMPFGFYRASSGIDPTILQMEPGALIPVDNPQTDVYFPNLGNRTVFGMQEEAAIQNMVERLTSISDINLGLMNGQGATRTATGARALMSEMSSNLDVFLRRLNWGWTSALKYLLEMLQQRIPDGVAFRLTGDSGADTFRTINSSKDIYGDFDIEVSANSATSNAAMMQEQAQQIAQIVADPLAIQLGIVTPAQYYNSRENLLKSLGVRDFGKYLQKPQGPLRVFTPEEEANRILRGMPVPVSPEQDHAGYLAWFEHVMKDDELLGQFNEDQTILLAKQAQAHEQMMGALQQMEAQKANSNQMQANAAQSAQQTAPASPAQQAPGGIPNAGG